MKNLKSFLPAVCFVTLFLGAAVCADNPLMMDTFAARPATRPSGVHHLVVTLPEKNNVEIDWISFE